MTCPNCGRKSKKNFCIFCGYMNNGNTINKTKSPDSDLEIYLNYDYDKIVRNNTYLSTFLLGPLYLCYKNYFLVGIVLEILDICAFVLANYLISFINIGFGLFSLSTILIILYIIFRFIFWMTFDNLIYIALINKKIAKLKKIYKTDYKEIIANDKKRDNFILPLSVIALFILFIILLFLIYRTIK